MSLVDEAVWVELKSQLSSRLPQVLYEQWFAGAEILSWDGERLELGVQNRFFSSRIETKYMSVLRESAEAAFGCPVTVAVSVSKRLLAAFRKAQNEAKEQLAKMKAESPAPALSYAPASPEEEPRYGLDLNPDFTFDSFVVGASNRLSHAVALRAVDNPGDFKRIYLCGQHGVGKTHLLQAICREVRARRPGTAVVYVTCERFMADFTSAHASGKIKEFRAFYRKCDLLALDELQALGVGNRAGTMAEIMGIIDDLDARGKQVLLSATQAPADLEGVDAKLRDRLGAGFVDRIDLPDESTRRELIVRKMGERRIDLPASAVNLLARELPGNVRKIEGTLHRLAALIDLEGMEPTTSCIRMALEVEAPVARGTPLSLEDIIRGVAEEYGVAVEALTGRGRAQALRQARQVAIALCRRLVGARYSELGDAFGKRSHATIISAMKTMPPELFGAGLESRPVERILFRLGLAIKPEEVFDRQKRLF